MGTPSPNSIYMDIFPLSNMHPKDVPEGELGHIQNFAVNIFIFSGAGFFLSNPFTREICILDF